MIDTKLQLRTAEVTHCDFSIDFQCKFAIYIFSFIKPLFSLTNHQFEMFALKRIATPLRSFAMTQQMLMSRVAGTVKFFDSVKGFGFIAPAYASADVFVHQSNIKSNGFRSLGEGEKVEFKVETSEDTGKRYAVEVTGPGGAEPKGWATLLVSKTVVGFTSTCAA